MADLFPYVVKQGEFLAKIAHLRGFDAQEVWDHPKNAALKQQRKQPALMCPGDILWMPRTGREPHQLLLQSNNKFRAQLPVVRIQHEFSVDGEPLADLEYRVYGMGEVFEDVSDEQGKIDVDVPIHVPSVKVVFETGMVYRLQVGHSDPANSETGAMQRLKQLGYMSDWDHGSVEATERSYALALEGFQRQHDLKPTGVLDEATIATLEKEFGC